MSIVLWMFHWHAVGARVSPRMADWTMLRHVNGLDLGPWILVAISSIEWSSPGTLLNHFFRHYKMEKKGLGVVLEGFIIFSINYSFWARCTL